MNSAPTAITCCLCVALCPAVCVLEAAAHALEHAHAHDDTVPRSQLYHESRDHQQCGHAHANDHTLHHEHDASGDPIPSSSHACFCTIAATTPCSLHAPEFVVVAFVGTSHDDFGEFAVRERLSASARTSLHISPPGPGDTLPLLI